MIGNGVKRNKIMSETNKRSWYKTSKQRLKDVSTVIALELSKIYNNYNKKNQRLQCYQLFHSQIILKISWKNLNQETIML